MIARRSPATLCASLLLTAACGKEQPGPPGPPACQQGPMEVEVGTGQSTFVPMPGGGDLPFFQGPQGGFHVYGSVRARGYNPAATDAATDPDHPAVQFRLRLGGQSIASSTLLHWSLAPVADGWRTRAGAFVIMTVPSPLQLDGDAVTLEVQVTDRCQLVGTDARDGVLRFSGPGPPPP